MATSPRWFAAFASLESQLKLVNVFDFTELKLEAIRNPGHLAAVELPQTPDPKWLRKCAACVNQPFLPTWIGLANKDWLSLKFQLRTLGLAHLFCSPHEARQLDTIVGRHYNAFPTDPAPLEEAIEDRLPWGESPTPSFRVKPPN